MNFRESDFLRWKRTPILFHDVILTLQWCKDTRNSAGRLPGVRIEKARYRITRERALITAPP